MQTEEKKYDLNLSSKYVPDWSVWEIGREIISNAIDASPDEYSVEEMSDDLIIVKTPTWPQVKELKIIGCGSKKKDGETIGQFGEGLKMAALACTRQKEGRLFLSTPEYRANFFMRDEDDEKILTMKIEGSDPEEKECQIWIGFPGIRNAIKGRFTKDPIGPLKKDEQRATCRIFVKGVFMQEIKSKSLHDWNIPFATFGRDRNVVEQTIVNLHIANWINDNMNDSLADQIKLIDGSYIEMKALEQWPERIFQSAREIIRNSLKRHFGADAIIATQNTNANKLAGARGKTVMVLSEGLARVVRTRDNSDTSGIHTSEDLLKKGSVLTQVLIKPEWKESITEIEKIMDLISIPAEIRIFENFAGAEAGLAVLQDDRLGCIMWINESLFFPSRRLERIATAIHELCHIRDKGEDASLEFEKSLDTVAAIIAQAWLDK